MISRLGQGSVQCHFKELSACTYLPRTGPMMSNVARKALLNTRMHAENRSRDDCVKMTNLDHFQFMSVEQAPIVA